MAAITKGKEKTNEKKLKTENLSVSKQLKGSLRFK